MIFSSVAFFVFFALVLITLYLLKGHERAKRWLLLIASYYFYATWDWRFLSLILISTFVDYFCGAHIAKAKSVVKKRAYLILSLCVNLGLLGFFKYFNFFIDSANRVFGIFNFNLSTLHIILPVGISFYTFQTLSYTLDIYRGKLKPTKSFLHFAIFVAFFPQLVAGPIVRAIEFLGQLDKKIVVQKSNIIIGAQFFLLGFIKKLFIADRIALFVDGVFQNPLIYSSATIWLALIGFAIQIYCDFSGYSDMAIGVARCMGFTLPMNFRIPYIAKSLSEFWHRWHISLSTWFRDYLYFPLGGNRVSSARWYFNIFTVFLVSGLWHGAAWTFVIWGAIHGFCLICSAVTKDIRQKLYVFFKLEKIPRVHKCLSIVYIFIIVNIGWVFFRARSFSDAIIFIRQMISFAPGVQWYYIPLLLLIPFFIFVQMADHRLYTKGYLVRTEKFWELVILVFVLVMLFFLSPTNTSPFIYYQF